MKSPPEFLASCISVMMVWGGHQIIGKLFLERVLGSGLDRAKYPGGHRVATPQHCSFRLQRSPHSTTTPRRTPAHTTKAFCQSHQQEPVQVKVLAAGRGAPPREVGHMRCLFSAPQGLWGPVSSHLWVPGGPPVLPGSLPGAGPWPACRLAP